MMKALFFLLSLFVLGNVSAQNEEIPFPSTDTEFPGGSAELKRFVAAQLKYPELALINRDQGRVYVSFVVEADGRLSGIEVQRGVTPELDAEAIRIISSMPRWIPAQHNGENIPVRCRMPITFSVDRKTSRRARKEFRKRTK